MQISYNYDNLPRDVLVFVEFSESETAQVIGSNRDLGVIVSSRFTYIGWAEFNASKIMVSDSAKKVLVK